MSSNFPTWLQAKSTLTPSESNQEVRRKLSDEERFMRSVRRDLKAVAKEYSPEALKYFVEVLRNEKATIQQRMAAASFIIERGWGKATNNVDVSVNVYENLSTEDLVKFITEGTTIEGELSDPDDDDDAESDEE